MSPNVAVHKTATQVSAFWNPDRQPEPLDAHFAVDGSFGGYCAITTPQYGAWWQVDLDEPHRIERVAITTYVNYGKCLSTVINKYSLQIPCWTKVVVVTPISPENNSCTVHL